MLAAAATDRILRGGVSGSNTSATLQAPVGLVWWRRLQGMRASRGQDLAAVVDR